MNQQVDFSQESSNLGSQDFEGNEDNKEEGMAVQWAKKLDLPDISYQKIIKKDSQLSLDAIASYVDKTKKDIDQYRIDQEESLQLRYTQMVEKVKLDVTKKYTEQLDAFKKNAALYFDCLEVHCSTIVKESIGVLGKEIIDQERLLSSVKAASANIKDEGAITLRVNPAQLDEITDLAASRSWSVEEDPKIAKGDCSFDVPLGKHSSQFDTTWLTLLELIE